MAVTPNPHRTRVRPLDSRAAATKKRSQGVHAIVVAAFRKAVDERT